MAAEGTKPPKENEAILYIRLQGKLYKCYQYKKKVMVKILTLRQFN